MLRWLITALVLVLALASPSMAEAPCSDVVEVDAPRHLRQLTLDLWGRVPTIEELDALDGDVTDAQVDAMLADEGFSRFVRRHHQDLLWPSVEGFQLVNPALALLLPASFYEIDETPERLFVIYVGLYGRGGLVPCKDEPAQFDEDGYPIMEAWPDGTQREGWVEIAPYWAPETTVKVCALEARTLTASASGADCATYQGMITGDCGCGPGLERCLSLDAADVILGSLQEQMMAMIEEPIEEGRSYYDALTEPEDLLNGPLIHYYRHLMPMAVDPFMLYPPIPADDLPTDVPFTDGTWSRHTRTLGPHSGILTNLLFLMRFQTARARADRFYDAFICSPFQAPGTSLPSPNDPCSNEPNLRLRCGCNGCHAALEPAAAHWASFVDAGTVYLDPALFPAFHPGCATCAETAGGCNDLCRRFYLTEAGHPDEKKYVGMLQSYVFRDGDEIARLQVGPAALVADHLESGALARCTAQRVFERLHGREMTSGERGSILSPVVETFVASGYDFKALVKAWLTSDSYRRTAR